MVVILHSGSCDPKTQCHCGAAHAQWVVYAVLHPGLLATKSASCVFRHRAAACGSHTRSPFETKLATVSKKIECKTFHPKQA